MTIEYAEDVIGNFTLHRRPVKRGPYQLAPGQNQYGYGKKITTDICLKFEGEKKERRVYCCCYSNNGSNYVIVGGRTLYLKRTYFQDDILDD